MTRACRDFVVCTVAHIPEPRFQSLLLCSPHHTYSPWERSILVDNSLMRMIENDFVDVFQVLSSGPCVLNISEQRPFPERDSKITSFLSIASARVRNLWLIVCGLMGCVCSCTDKVMHPPSFFLLFFLFFFLIRCLIVCVTVSVSMECNCFGVSMSC